MPEPAWITSDLVKKFWAELQSRYGTQIVSKSDSGFMEFIAKFLGGIGVLNKQDFMTRFTTTIGSKIYVPFEIGEAGASGRHTLSGQITIAAHEHQHVLQSNRDGAVEFSWKYLVDKSDRALYEAEAYLTSMEVWHFMYGNVPAASYYANKLKHYGVGEDDIELARRRLESGRHTLINYGGISTELGRVSIELLKELKAGSAG